MKENNAEKGSDNWIWRLIASEILWYTGYDWYIHANYPVVIDVYMVVTLNILITGGLFLFLSAFDC